jgi:hypothetical protein
MAETLEIDQGRSSLRLGARSIFVRWLSIEGSLRRSLRLRCCLSWRVLTRQESRDLDPPIRKLSGRELLCAPFAIITA